MNRIAWNRFHNDGDVNYSTCINITSSFVYKHFLQQGKWMGFNGPRCELQFCLYSWDWRHNLRVSWAHLCDTGQRPALCSGGSLILFPVAGGGGDWSGVSLMFVHFRGGNTPLTLGILRHHQRCNSWFTNCLRISKPPLLIWCEPAEPTNAPLA